ncbi:MAG: sulfate reduction electron transfer complex DsrMKJOP subunit DsrM [Deltaproteobacteria bacterium]|nr:sulfate reduction electron transfer complex DsrMKJOP subunit DsrM [Deltaproteobacteria bacterium]
MNFITSFLLTVGLFIVGYFGSRLPFVFGLVIPYTALTLFVLGLVCRMIAWARVPVPFRIPTTCGQQRSLSWIKSNNLESPFNLLGVVGRMFLEVFFFRSLFRNTKAELYDGTRLVYGSNKFLWVGAMAFHWSFLLIVLRHFRFFTEPVLPCVLWLQDLDGLFEIAVPAFYLTNFFIVAALGYLLARRLFNPQVRYISLGSDYFALFLILAIALTGIWMRYIDKVDVVKIKELVMSLVAFAPVVPDGIGWLFFVHLFFVCVLLAYFPFSKLLHMPGVFFSPTRNLANNNRAKRHINPWNPEVKCHTYEEWEDEFRDTLKRIGLPLDKAE